MAGAAAAAPLGGEVDQRLQIGPAEALEARQDVGVAVGQHQRRDGVEAVLLGNREFGVERARKREPVTLRERGGERRVVLRHPEHAQPARRQRPVHALDQRCGQVAGRAVVLEEEQQRRGRRGSPGTERARVAAGVAQRERSRFRTGHGERGHGAAQYKIGAGRLTGNDPRPEPPAIRSGNPRAQQAAGHCCGRSGPTRGHGSTAGGTAGIRGCSRWAAVLETTRRCR